MCGLCSQDKAEWERAIKGAEFMAERLERAAKEYRAYASGLVKPHDERAKAFSAVARGIIRDLVEEWV